MKKEKAFLGIDPGKTGAAVLIVVGGEIEYVDWEGVDDISKKISDWADKYDIVYAALEKVASRPGQGVASTFKFGVNFGVWQGILTMAGINYMLVTPATWKKHLIKKKKNEDIKKAALRVARAMFAHKVDWIKREKDHNRAEALLLAYYAIKTYKKGV